MPFTVSTEGRSWVSRMLCKRRITAQSRLRRSLSALFAGNRTPPVAVLLAKLLYAILAHSIPAVVVKSRHNPNERISATERRAEARRVAVGMPVTQHPPHSPVLARLTHTVLALDVWRRNALSDTDGGAQSQVARRRVVPGNAATSSGSADSVAVAYAANFASLRAETPSVAPRYRGRHGIGNTHLPPTATTPASPGCSRAFVSAASHEFPSAWLPFACRSSSGVP